MPCGFGIGGELLEEGRGLGRVASEQGLGHGEADAAIGLVVLAAVAVVGEVAGDLLAIRLRSGQSEGYFPGFAGAGGNGFRGSWLLSSSQQHGKKCTTDLRARDDHHAVRMREWNAVACLKCTLIAGGAGE